MMTGFTGLLVAACVLCGAMGATITVPLTSGAVPKGSTIPTDNVMAFNKALEAAAPGDTVLVPEGTFSMTGGVNGTGLQNVTLVVDGTLVAYPNTTVWPLQPRSNDYAHFLYFEECSDLTITGSGAINGNGAPWWLGFIFGTIKDKRPKLLYVTESRGVVLRDLTLINSPSFHVELSDVAGAEVSGVNVTVYLELMSAVKVAKRAIRGQTVGSDVLAGVAVEAEAMGHEVFIRRMGEVLDGGSVEGVGVFEAQLHEVMLVQAAKDATGPPLEPEDLNTDGIDPSGTNVWIHDVYIYNDDDSIAVKPSNEASWASNCSENMVIENSIFHGFGASIGSVPPHDNVNCVRNITFRNITMPGTGKGIYVKSNPTCTGANSAVIHDITYEDFTINKPVWWPIWIGPQQQHEPGVSLGRKCALDFPLNPHCPTQGCVDFRNITLRNIEITKPLLSAGVLLGNDTNPMQGIVFDNVVVNDPGHWPYNATDNYYLCPEGGVHGTATGSSPVPLCLEAA